MSEKMKKIVTMTVLIVILIISIVLTVVGQRNIGPAGLLTMLVGLAGLICLLWFYNRQYK